MSHAHPRMIAVTGAGAGIGGARAASPRGATASFVTGAPRVANGGARSVDVSTLAFEDA